MVPALVLPVHDPSGVLLTQLANVSPRYANSLPARFSASLQQPNSYTFQRSSHAWASYPKPYREVEQIAITLGKYLFHRYLDFAWSYLVIRAADLQTIIPQIRQRTFRMLAEIVLLLHDQLYTQEVDWLFWEDPFIEARDPDELRRECEASLQEMQKRLRANAPIIRLLLDRVDL